MTLTLEIAPEVEAALENQAAQAGEALPDYAARVLRDVATGQLVSPNSVREAEAERSRLAAIDAVAGKYAHLKDRGFNTATMHAERDKDKVHEDRFNERFEKRTERAA